MIFQLFLDEIPPSTYLIGVSADECSRNLFLADEGLTSFGFYYGIIRYREAMVFVARKDDPGSLVFNKTAITKGPIFLELNLKHEAGDYKISITFDSFLLYLKIASLSK